MHLNGQLGERYRAGNLDSRIATAIDVHVSNCFQCARQLAEASAAAESWERRGWLGRLVRVGQEPAPAVRSMGRAPSGARLGRAA
jgi:hypothetical protein